MIGLGMGIEEVGGHVLRWLERRKINRNRKIIADGLKELHNMTVTIHGRYMLSQVINDPDNGLEPEIRRMYLVLLQTAPIAEVAMWN